MKLFTLQGKRHCRVLAAGDPVIDPRAESGGIMLKVPPRTTRNLPVVFAWYVHGPVTQGAGSTGDACTRIIFRGLRRWRIF